MKDLANITLNELEAQRDEAAQAAREVETLDPRSVLLTLQGWIASGQIERAKRAVAEYRASKQVTA
jgi:hypothetical protein